MALGLAQTVDDLIGVIRSGGPPAMSSPRRATETSDQSGAAAAPRGVRRARPDDAGAIEAMMRARVPAHCRSRAAAAVIDSVDSRATRNPADGIAPAIAGPVENQRWPAGSGVMRRPLVPLPNRPNPTDPGDAADLSIPQGF
jgi:hypothetical protein